MKRYDLLLIGWMELNLKILIVWTDAINAICAVLKQLRSFIMNVCNLLMLFTAVHSSSPLFDQRSSSCPHGPKLLSKLSAPLDSVLLDSSCLSAEME